MSIKVAEYDQLIREIGEPSSPVMPSAGFGQEFGSVLPIGYLEFVVKYGFGIYRNGYFQTVEPKAYKSVLVQIFRNDYSMEVSNINTIGISAFGDMLLFDQKFGIIEISQAQHWISLNTFEASNSDTADFEIRTALSNFTKDFDNYDEDGFPLFRRCLDKYGALGRGQIYAPLVPLSAGGAARLENYRIVEAATALALDAQWAPYNLMDFSSPDGPKLIRTVGRK
jgi:hypothetical protein